MSKNVSKSLRIITLAPFMASLLFIILFFTKPNSFANTLHLFFAFMFIVILPLLAYPISYLVPRIKVKGRSGQRKLAIILSVVGYIFGFVFALITDAPSLEKIIYLTYLLSGVFMAVLNFGFKIKSSGHSCGISGPIICLSFLVSWWYVFGYLVLVIVAFASFQLKSHDTKEVIIGSFLPVIAFIISNIIF